MKIKYLGHSSFLLTESTGTALVTDPYNASVGYEMPKVKCDIVTVSHNHGDHNNVAGVLGKPEVITKEGVFERGGVEINGIKTFHDSEEGALRGDNTIYKFRMDGVEVCHMGDIGEPCNADLVEMLMPVDVLLIPVGGNYTIDAEEAKEYVDRLMPEIVIPMHYKTKESDLEIDKVDEFLKLFEDDIEIEESEDSQIEISRNDIENDTKIVVLKKN